LLIVTLITRSVERSSCMSKCMDKQPASEAKNSKVHDLLRGVAIQWVH
jgi:hypothetical protein